MADVAGPGSALADEPRAGLPLRPAGQRGAHGDHEALRRARRTGHPALVQGYRDYDFDDAVEQLTILWGNALGLEHPRGRTTA